MKRIVVFALGAFLCAPLPASEPEPGGKKLGPRAVLWRLRQGNQAFVSGRLTPAKASPARRASLIGGQQPLAVILTCADSRVPPEHIFNEGLGHLFVVRVAGVVADPVVVGSVEYAAEHLHTPLIVVMGHTRCGAVKAAIETPVPPPPGGPGANIETILALLRPGIPKGEPQKDPWATAVYGGVEQSVGDLLHLSKIIPEMAEAGHLGVVGAVYELETGRVVFSEPVPAGHPAEGVRLVNWKGSRQPEPRTHAQARPEAPAHAH